jgi:hypothetical protein
MESARPASRRSRNSSRRDHGSRPPFRSDIITGPGGKQIQLLDADGNPIELFEPAR